MFRYPIATFTDDNRIMVGANTNPAYSMLIGMPASITTVDFIVEVLAGTLGRAISYYDASGSKRVFTYMDDLNSPN